MRRGVSEEYRPPPPPSSTHGIKEGKLVSLRPLYSKLIVEFVLHYKVEQTFSGLVVGESGVGKRLRDLRG